MTDHTTNAIVIDPDNIKKIRIRCRCGNTIIAKIPQEVRDTGLKVANHCNACGTIYIYCKGKVAREDGKRLEQNDNPLPEAPTVDASGFKTRPGAFHVPPPKSDMAN